MATSPSPRREVDTPTSSHSPVFVSADGVAWRPLAADALGEHAVIVRIVESRDGLVAVTLTGGHRDLRRPRGDRVLGPTLPLVAYTSRDGASWAPHPVAGSTSSPTATTAS